MNLEHFKQVIIGSTVEEAENLSKEFIVRIMERNGESLFGSCEFRENRVNVAVEDGVITQVLSVG